MFETYSTTTEVTYIDPDGGYATCYTCGGKLELSYVAVCSDNHSRHFCSNCVPQVGDFIRIPV